MRKIKLGIFLGSAPPFGGGQFHYIQTILDAALALPQHQFSVVVSHTNPLWREYLKALGHNSLFIENRGWWKVFGDMWLTLGLPGRTWRYISAHFDTVARTLLRERCDLWIFPTQDSWCSQFPLPAIAVIHDLMHRYEPNFPEVAKYARRRFRDNYLKDRCKYAEGILVDSETGRQHVKESYGVAPDRIFCLPYIPARHICAARISPGLMSKYNLPEKFVFYPAQFWSHKNHVNLIAAVREVRKSCPDIRLVLVGSRNNGYHDVLEYVKKHDLEKNVIFAGYVPDEDMPGFYKYARALIMPTFFGPTNIPPLEAMVLGCPIAASSIYGMPEQLGDSALWFDPKSVDQIAQRIEQLWTNDALCALLSQRGKQRASLWGAPQFNEAFHRIVCEIADRTDI